MTMMMTTMAKIKGKKLTKSWSDTSHPPSKRAVFQSYQVDNEDDDDDDEDEDEDEGAKMSFQIVKNLICISLESKYIYKSKNFVHVKSLMGFKI